MSKINRLLYLKWILPPSAFNITASGTHYFSNHYNYKVKVFLSEILWEKQKRPKRENEESHCRGRWTWVNSLYLSFEVLKRIIRYRTDQKRPLIVC